MGIQLDVTAFQDSPEERERRRRDGTKKRILVLISTLTISILARFIIKDPKPPAPPDYSKDTVRYIPGMLDALPASERARLDPKIVARMIKADEDALRGISKAPESMLAQGPYRPAEPKIEAEIEAEIFKEQVFSYAKRRRLELQNQRAPELADLAKTMLVRFQGGGYIKAERTEHHPGTVEIRIDKTIHAQVPNNMVASVSNNALTWEEPIPTGCVKIKPAKGITITIGRETARRISVRKDSFNEI